MHLYSSWMVKLIFQHPMPRYKYVASLEASLTKYTYKRKLIPLKVNILICEFRGKLMCLTQHSSTRIFRMVVGVRSWVMAELFQVLDDERGKRARRLATAGNWVNPLYPSPDPLLLSSPLTGSEKGRRQKSPSLFFLSGFLPQRFTFCKNK